MAKDSALIQAKHAGVCVCAWQPQPAQAESSRLCMARSCMRGILMPSCITPCPLLWFAETSTHAPETQSTQQLHIRPCHQNCTALLPE